MAKKAEGARSALLNYLLAKNPSLREEFSVLDPPEVPPLDPERIHALAPFMANAEANRQRIEALHDNFLEHSPARQRMVFRNSSHQTRYLLLHTLVNHAYTLRFDDPKAGLAEVELALTLLPDLDPQGAPEGFTQDLAAKIHAVHGNFLRIHSRLAESAAAFSLALAALRQGTRTELERAQYNELAADLDIVLGKLNVARNKLNQTVRAYQENRHIRLPDALIRRALVASYLEDYPPALRDYSAAIQETTDSRLVLIAATNRAMTYNFAGNPRRALEYLFALEPLYKEPSAKPFIPFRDWIHGQIALALDWPDEALAKLTAAMDAFIAKDDLVHAVLTGITLSRAYLAAGNTRELLDLATKLETMARVPGLLTEQTAAVLFVVAAARSSTLTVVAAAACERYLRLSPSRRDITYR